MTYDHRNTGTREDLLRARSEGRSHMARRRITIVYRFSPREDLYARTQRYVLEKKFLRNMIGWKKKRKTMLMVLVWTPEMQYNEFSFLFKASLAINGRNPRWGYYFALSTSKVRFHSNSGFHSGSNISFTHYANQRYPTVGGPRLKFS